MPDILIIGSEGFIGKNLVRFYVTHGWNVTGIDRLDNPSDEYRYFKLLSISEISSILMMQQFQYVINAAGSGNVSFSMEHPLGDYEANCSDTARILDALRLLNKKAKYLHISSAAVYGNPKSLPVKEDAPVHPLSPYGWHKLMSEFQCKEFHEVYGMHTCCVRPFSVYGPGLRKQLFWDIYNKARLNDEVILFGSGNESRDFVYITDVVNAFDQVIQKGEMQGEVYNIGSGIETSIHDAASMFLRNASSDISLKFNGQTKAGDPLNWKADINKIKSLGWRCETSIVQGISNTYKWIHNNFLPGEM